MAKNQRDRPGVRPGPIGNSVVGLQWEPSHFPRCLHVSAAAGFKLSRCLPRRVSMLSPWALRPTPGLNTLTPATGFPEAAAGPPRTTQTKE